MTSVTKLEKKLSRAMANGPRGLEEGEIPNAVPHRRSLPTPIDMIVVEGRLRSVDEAAVEHMAESMQRLGQLYPIQVNTIEPGQFRLVAGAHRIAAARKLGWTHIEAFLVDDLEEEEISLLEIDENLFRAELNSLDRCRFLAKRKEIYERLHPETRHGANLVLPPRQHDKINGLRPAERAPSFVEDTAASTRWSRRTISRSTRIGERISPDLQVALADTPIARRTVDLERIADMRPDAQQDVLDRLTGTAQTPLSLSSLMNDPNRPPSPPKSNLDKLKDLWSRTSTNHRRQFFEHLWTEASDAKREQFRGWLSTQEGSS